VDLGARSVDLGARSVDLGARSAVTSTSVSLDDTLVDLDPRSASRSTLIRKPSTEQSPPADDGHPHDPMERVNAPTAPQPTPDITAIVAATEDASALSE
jgi:hypothetical protein